MPVSSLSSQNFSEYQEALSASTSAKKSFSSITELYVRLAVNEEELEALQFAAALSEIQAQHDLEKDGFRNEHSTLKSVRKAIDDRILTVEQKLYLGLPDDLAEMDRLIAEQEAIVADQEELNENELALMEKMSRSDISYGKKLAALDQSKSNRDLPLKAKLERQLLQVAAAEKQNTSRTGIFSMVIMLLVPIVLDYIAFLLGLNGKGNTRLIFSHFVFLISLIVIQVFFTDQIKQKISNFLAKTQCEVFLKEISESLDTIEKSKRKLSIERR
ncbi:hypothetical protein GJU39_07535 [Pedobacter petrophilus]|uniref:Uncharacterized protein n=1 Tax=Pedobacter petrophilus TaxID=1908241 RepID=A0A7K0FY97_9SPHI|nr:hypothetical protein [Pedobacter petrophilus]MRX75939.1 hypothetical protein [Pedobacter petrophilus]